jgi:anti-sigma regulatory factor (Ser/Thr protein kinase)
MCNDHYDDDPVDVMDPEEALECLYDIGTDRSHRLIKMIEYYMDQIVYQESSGIG